MEEISGGNSREAISRSLNSSSSKSTANLTASKTLVSSATLRFLALGRIGGFADEEGFSLFVRRVEASEGLTAAIGLDASTRCLGSSDEGAAVVEVGTVDRDGCVGV